jgi:hypothetical protein
MTIATNNRRPNRNRLVVSGLVGVCATVAGALAGYRALVTQPAASPAPTLRQSLARLFEGVRADPPVAKESVSSAKFEAYVRAYAAMQRDRTLSIERAARQQGLSVSAFRQIEEQIEQNPQLRRRARRLLLEAVEHPERASESSWPSGVPR